jgi:TetR/AcrR family transcriptional repressor of mexJK operon
MTLPGKDDLPLFPETDLGDTRQRILSEAARLFAKMGYARTTTRALAAAAGVTEVTLFRHFESKEKLFEAVAQRFGGTAVASALEAQLTGEDYRADLMRVGTMFMRVMQERGEVVRLMLCEASYFPEMRDVLAQNPRALRALMAHYLGQQLEQKRIRSIHTEAASQAFLGMLFSYKLLTELLVDPADERISTEQIVETAVDIFVNGTINPE